MTRAYTAILNDYKQGLPITIGIMGDSIGCGLRTENTFSPNPYNSLENGILELDGISRITVASQHDIRIQSWAIKLMQFLQLKNSQSTIQNVSISGGTANFHVLQNSVALIASRVPKPDMCIIPLQINDVQHFTLSEWQADMRTLINQLIAVDITPVLMKENDITGGSDNWQYYDFLAAVDALGAEQGLAVIDGFTYFQNAITILGKDALLWDYVHPSKLGHNAIFNSVQKFIVSTTNVSLSSSYGNLYGSYYGGGMNIRFKVSGELKECMGGYIKVNSQIQRIIKVYIKNSGEIHLIQ